MKSDSPFVKSFSIALIFILVLPVWMFWRGWTEEAHFKTLLTWMEADFLIAATVSGAWAYRRRTPWTWHSAFMSFLLVMLLVPGIFVAGLWLFMQARR